MMNEHSLWELLDFKTNKEFNISIHPHLNLTGHELSKIVYHYLISSTENYVIHIDLYKN